MQSTKYVILRQIAARAQREVKHLAGEFARAASAEKEEILAALEFERWLADSCQEVLQND
jgi:hypothetical protein